MTVKELITELDKFPMNASIIHYEGESIGITVGNVNREYGSIYTEDDKDTELFEG